MSKVPAARKPSPGDVLVEGQSPADDHSPEVTALRESEARFRGAFDHAAVGMAIAERDGTWTRVNRALCALLGYAEAELAGRTFQSLTHSDDLAANLDLLQRALAGEIDVCRMEKRLLHKRGHPVWVAMEAAVVRDASDASLYFLAQFQDVTERKVEEVARRESVRRHARVVTNAPGMVYQFVYRANGTQAFSFVSDSARALVGVEPEAMLRDPMALFGLVHPDDVEGMRASGQASRLALAPWSWEGRVVLHTGEEKRVQAASRLEPQADGSIVCDGILMDVTAQRHAAAQLEESEQRYRSLFDHHPDAVFRLDRNGEFLSVNPGCERISGYEPAELLGHSFAPLIVPEHLALAHRHFDAAVAGTAQNYEVTIRHRQGHRVDLEVANIPVVVGGKVVGVFGIAKDLTRRHALEAQLRQSQKMETVGQLAGGVAHDFNNIIAAMSGFAELLCAELEPGDPRRADAEEIVKGARRAADLTRQLLAFSRKQVLQPATVDLNQVVKETATMLRPLLGATLHLVTRPASSPIAVFADRSQLEQVLMNLAVNARDAMPNGGTLTIEVGVTTPDADAGDARPLATLLVRDTGIGMSADVAAHAFEPFYTTKPLGEGSGLGLATVHGIVQQSGGTIRFVSRPGMGTTFTVTLPLVEAVAWPVEPPTERASSRTEATVLLVEDEDPVRAIARRLLERAGYRVLVARHGADALRMLAEIDTPVDILLSDVAMPEMGGIELAALAVAQRPGLRVVLMSGYADADVGEIGEDQLVNGFITKPFAADALHRTLFEALQRVR